MSILFMLRGNCPIEGAARAGTFTTGVGARIELKRLVDSAAMVLWSAGRESVEHVATIKKTTRHDPPRSAVPVLNCRQLLLF